MKPAVSAVHSEPHSGTIQWEVYAVWSMALIVVFSAVVWAFFCDHPQEFDDIGLFNVPYMYAHYGVLTYPAHGEFQALTVHPPIHYWLLGLFMKSGVPPFYAEAILPLLMIFLGVFLILCSEFPSPVKAGLLLAYCTPFLFVRFVPTMRPDIHRGLALFTGLMALETGRLKNWNLARLFAGSFLVTYASALHYPGFAGFLGVFVYIVWVFFDEKGAKWKKPVIALISGGCLVGVPYLAFFVIPHHREIIAAVTSVEPFEGINSSLRVHLQAYASRFWTSTLGPGLSSALPTRLFFSPVAAGIPLILISTTTLLASRATRGLALSSLPYPFFLLFWTSHKLYWEGYFLPEFMLYTAAVGILIAWGLYYLCNCIGERSNVAWIVAFTACILSLLSSSPSLANARLSLYPRFYEAEIARAAGRAMIGSNALVGSRNAIMFYASGAAYYYDVSPDVLWNSSVPLDLRKYFSPFDAIIEHQAFSASTQNVERKSLVSWYAEGILNLRGFYLSSENAALPYLALKTQPEEHVQGFASLKNNDVAYFREQRNGEYEFVAAVCSQEARPSLTNLFINAYALPSKTDEPSLKELVTWLAKREDYDASRLAVLDKCQLRDEVSLSMTRVDAYQFLTTNLQNDQPIRFFEHLEDAITARYGPSIQFEVTADGWLDRVEFHRGQHKGEAYSLSSEGADQIFRSDMNSTGGWQVNHYGSDGGLEILPSGLQKGDHSGQYSSGDSRDHLSSPFFNEPLDVGLLFFSLWVKPLRNSALPEVYLQNTNYVRLGDAYPAMTRSDGWVLLAGWGEANKQEEVRMVVVQKPETTSLLDKALVVECANHSSIQ